MKPDRASFPGLAPYHFTHPEDDAELQRMQQFPLLNTVVDKMQQYEFERLLRLRAMAEDIKVGRRTCSRLHAMSQDIAARLDLPQVDLFVKQQPTPAAATTGVRYPLIVLHSGLVDLLSDDELYVALAHEYGHIKCGHTLYLTAGCFLQTMGGLLSLAGLAVKGLQLGLLEWSRKAQYSCDRAALLCCQDNELVQHTLVKLAGGSSRLAGEIDFEDFHKQGEMFDAMTERLDLNRFYRMLVAAPMSQPFPVVRAREIATWAHEEMYGKLIRGEYAPGEAPAREQPSACPHCGASLSGTEVHCPACTCLVVPLVEKTGPGIEESVSQAFREATDQFSESINQAFGELRRFFGDLTAPQPDTLNPRLICPECQARNSPGSRYCNRCGALLDGSEE